MLSALLFVDYQWCHVLFNNNTVSKMMIMEMIMEMMMRMIMEMIMAIIVTDFW